MINMQKTEKSGIGQMLLYLEKLNSKKVKNKNAINAKSYDLVLFS